MVQKIIIVIGVLLTHISVFGQLNYSEVDQRVIDVYGEARVKELLTSQPQFIDYMNYYVKNSYQIVTGMPARKLVYFDDISTLVNSRTGDLINHSEIDNLNIMLLTLTREPEEYLTYKVGETGVVVVFISTKTLIDQYKANKKAGVKL